MVHFIFKFITIGTLNSFARYAGWPREVKKQDCQDEGVPINLHDTLFFLCYYESGCLKINKLKLIIFI